jgi:hypothetical protein
MNQKRGIDEILPKDAVGEVRGETPLERIVRILANNVSEIGAFAIIGIGLFVALVAMIASESLRAGAFQLVASAVSAALGFLFGTKKKQD